MASTEVSNNIIRYSGETYPSKSTIGIKSIPLDIAEDWRVEIRYRVPSGTILPGGALAVETTELVIDAVLTDPAKGKINIYPHARLRYVDGALSTAVLTPEAYVTSELRERLIASGVSEEDAPVVNQVWDDEEVEAAGGSVEYPFYTVRVKDYPAMGLEDGYQEEQVHNVGLVQIASRWLK